MTNRKELKKLIMQIRSKSLNHPMREEIEAAMILISIYHKPITKKQHTTRRTRIKKKISYKQQI
jgi:hypothetical protein